VLVPILDGASRETGTPNGDGLFSEKVVRRRSAGILRKRCDYTLHSSPVNHGSHDRTRSHGLLGSRAVPVVW
jgi:hypothetical protein